MPFTFTMPKLSPTMQEGVIARWHKKEGDLVESGDLLLEVSTDKATVEHNALDRGYIRKILKKQGDAAAVNEPLAIFTEKESENIDGYLVEGVKASVKTAPAPTPKEDLSNRSQKSLKMTVSTPTVSTQTTKNNQQKPCQESRILASPLAKSQARLQSIDLTTIQGTGPHGRIMSRDLAQAQDIAPTSTASIRQNDQEEALTPIRKVIADRLQYSKNTIPHFYIQQDINIESLVSMREHVKKEEKNLTINDFIIKAVAVALRQHRSINSGFNPETNQVVRYANIDISVAVTIQGGLITPILHNADLLSVSSLSQQMKSLAVKAKEGKLQPAEYIGGSFTISNLGMFGVTNFQAIVNPPQGAILAVGAVQEVPVIKNNAVVPGKILSLTLSCDHRIIDGSEAAQFMKTLKKLIENPLLFLTE